MYWLDRVAEWAWTLLIPAAAAILKLFQRVSVNEARIIALEAGHGRVGDKIDENHKALLNSVDGLRKELKDDYRMIVQALLEKVPKA